MADIYKLSPEVAEKYVVSFTSPRQVFVGIGQFDFRNISVAQADKLATHPRTAKYFTLKPAKKVKPDKESAADAE